MEQFQIYLAVLVSAYKFFSGKGWYRFHYMFEILKKASMDEFNEWPIQCFAVTDHEKKDKGNVMSVTTTLIVHCKSNTFASCHFKKEDQIQM